MGELHRQQEIAKEAVERLGLVPTHVKAIEARQGKPAPSEGRPGKRV